MMGQAQEPLTPARPVAAARGLCRARGRMRLLSRVRAPELRLVRVSMTLARLLFHCFTSPHRTELNEYSVRIRHGTVHFYSRPQGFGHP